MSTLTQVVTAVSLRLQDDSNTAVSTAVIVGVINESIEHWKKQRFWFNEFEESVTLSTSSATIPEPTTVTMLYPFENGGFSISYASQRWKVDKVKTQVYDSFNKQGYGLPFVYTFRNNAYEAYWYPDQAYTGIWRGVQDYTDFGSTASTESNVWLVEAESLIRNDVLSRLQGEVRLDPEMETYYTNRAQSEFQNLKKLTRKLNQTGRLETSSFLIGD